MTSGYLFGVGTLLVFWVLSYFVTGKKVAPWALAISESTVGGQVQGVLSASKLQALVWTLVTLFAYTSVFGTLLLESKPGAGLPSLPGIPVGLLVLMGLSVATAAGAKGVIVSYKSQGLIEERSGGLTTNPKQQGDLVKTQMLIWTFIGAGVYLLSVVKFIADKAWALDPTISLALPDVDSALLVLMGASAGSYIGDKLVSRDVLKKPKLESMLPLKGPGGTTITMLGENFGDDQGANFVSFDDSTIRSQADGLVSWSNLQVEATVPATYKPGDKIAVGVYRDGEWTGKLFFEVT